MSNMARNHKDNVFCLLYRDRKNLLSLYNAMNGTSYEKEEELEVVTLEGAICMKIKNDAAFVIDSSLNLYEQQASANRNMPLRNLYYVAEELKKIAPPRNLYRNTKVHIPAPKFVVFYNGVSPQPEKQVYKLSDLFAEETEEPELELKVTVFNINRGYNEELLQKCESLRGYTVFVEKVREKKAGGTQLETAVSEAVEECISENILAEFFVRYKEDVMDMDIWEFDQELHDQAMWEDGKVIGEREGTLQAIKNLMDTLKLTKEQAMDALKVPKRERAEYDID